jgi:hypothetical protein
MTDYPRASLRRVLEDLGTSLLELLCGDLEQPDHIESLVIYDPLDGLTGEPHALVLGIGVHEPQQIVAQLDDLGSRHCAGLIIRLPLEITPEIKDAAERSKVAVLGLAPGTSWMQLAAILRSVLAHGQVGKTGQEMLGGTASGDLFALANAIAALLDAPVTIEDRRSRVLAFSGRQDEADPSRIRTILDREVSSARTYELEQRGVFRELYRTDQPLFVEPPPSGLEGFTMPRVALAVRAGDEILGSIWAAVREPLSEERAQMLREIGPLVALHLLSERAGADVERRLRADLVATALEGGGGAAEAARRLGLSNQPAVVLALAIDDDAPSPAASHPGQLANRRRAADALAMYLTIAAPGSTAALVGDVAYGIMPVYGSLAGAEQRAAQRATEFLERMGTQMRAVVGIGTAASSPAELSRSREGADRALRVVRSRPMGQRIACIGERGLDALLLELGDLMAARGDPPVKAVARLLQYDAKHGTNLVETLQAWLNSFGNVLEASQAIWVHQNTFRYRLRKAASVAEIDLDDPDTRLSIMLQLRLLSMDGDGRSSVGDARKTR